MIKLLGILLSVSLLNGENIVYLLPDEQSIFEQWIKSHIKKSAAPLYILTPSIDYPELHRSILSHQSHGSDLVMIVNSLQKDPIRLIQYQKTYLYHYPGRPIAGTILITDPYVCQIPAPLDQQIMSSSTHTIFCTDDPQTIASAKRSFGLIQKRSTTYLK